MQINGTQIDWDANNRPEQWGKWRHELWLAEARRQHSATDEKEEKAPTPARGKDAYREPRKKKNGLKENGAGNEDINSNSLLNGGGGVDTKNLVFVVDNPHKLLLLILAF